MLYSITVQVRAITDMQADGNNGVSDPEQTSPGSGGEGAAIAETPQPVPPRGRSYGPTLMVVLLLVGLLAVVLSPDASNSPSPSPRAPAGAGLQCSATFSIGQQVSVSANGVHLRRSPGHVGKDTATDVIDRLFNGGAVTILEGPSPKDGLCWWRVRYREEEGWVADRTQDGTRLLAAN
jgi:hypothetical protein